jgi:hypothetical protein
MCLAILLASVLPLDLAIPFMALCIMGMLIYEVRSKDDLAVIRHRC